MKIRFLLSLFPLLAACAVESSSPTGEGERGGLGKADLVGSCEHKGQELCGGKGKGNCWCDESCVDFGDCCSDADEVCGIEPPPPEGQACGGLLGLQCDADEFCSYSEEDICGFADATGECVQRPDACIALFDPVCGCDGNTYGNSCNAASAGVSVAHDGECEQQGEFCGGFAGIQCPEGKECVDDPNDDCNPENGGADCGGICIPVEPKPFCGGFGNLPCPEGFECVDDPDDGCDPNNGGADCGGVCIPAADCPPVVCALFCENGFQTDENGCEICACVEDRDIAEGQCIKNSLDECTTDADCVSGGCGGELCFNPAEGGGISTCECTEPQGVACGCVNGQCAWFE